MRKIYSLLLFSALTLVGCSSDNDTPEQAFELEATGTVAEQTPEEAKKPLTENGLLEVLLLNLALQKDLTVLLLGSNLLTIALPLPLKLPAMTIMHLLMVLMN